MERWLSSYKNICCSFRGPKFKSQDTLFLTTACYSSSREFHAFCWPLQVPAHTCMCPSPLHNT